MNREKTHQLINATTESVSLVSHYFHQWMKGGDDDYLRNVFREGCKARRLMSKVIGVALKELPPEEQEEGDVC